ncbi:MAG: redoxin domain-containing protein [Candidatus Omnitrophica bacterium]|nr:redoxin domain-containing protein [Candidatus Omnitrophota bacterium]
MNKFRKFFPMLIILSSIFCQWGYASQDIDPQAIVSQIKQSYEKLADVKVRIIEQNRSQDAQVDAQGILQFKSPDKIKVDLEIVANSGKYRAKNILVYSNGILWQEQLNQDTQKISVFKSELANDSVQAREISSEFNPKQQFAYFIQMYDVIDVRLLNDEDASIYVLDMEIKPEERNQMIQMLKAQGQAQAELMVPEKASFYWDWNKEFVVKIETQSKNQDFKTLIEYSDISLNSGIKDKVFTYTPAPGIEVIDMTKIIDQEAGLREFEGVDNKLVGQVFPDFVLNDVFNDKYAYKDMQGKILIVNFWEHWCPPCRKEMPLLENLYQDIYTDDYVQLITITTDKDKALEVVEENSYSFPVLIDSQALLAGQLEVDSIPKTFVIDQQGLITAVYMGYHPDIEEILKKQINRLNPEE